MPGSSWAGGAVRDARIVLGVHVDGGSQKLREPDFRLSVHRLRHHQVVTAVVGARAARGGLPARKLAQPLAVRVGRALERGSVQRAACQIGLHARDPLAFHVEQATGEESARPVVVAADQAVAHVAVEHDDVALAGGEGRPAVAGVGPDGEPASRSGLVERDARFVFLALQKACEGRGSRDGECADQQAGRRRAPAPCQEALCGSFMRRGRSESVPSAVANNALDRRFPQLGRDGGARLQRRVALSELLFVHDRPPNSMRRALRARWRWERTVAGRSPVIFATSSVE